ncbi:MAG: bifunctional nuclease family protein [Candidatus Rokuibacteriota bacterium]
MGGKRSIALFGLLAVVLLTGTGAKEPGQAPPPKATGPQEAEVIGVVLDQRTQQPVVVLQGKRDKRQFAMAIGIAEANGIAIPLQGVTPPRPLTHDLFLTLFGRLKVSLMRVVITDFKDDIYYAIVHLSANGSDMTLDSRPSDAIALAIRAKVPILVEDRVFDKSGSSEPRSGPSPHF